MTPADSIIDEILLREGWPDYTNNPADRGGPTKGGITLRSWREYTGNPFATSEQLEDITEQQARSFYRHRHVIEPGFDHIDDPYLRELVVDAGVHHGIRRAAKWLQRAAGVTQDGVIGPNTLAAVNTTNARALYLYIVNYRLRLFGRLVGQDPELRRAEAAGFNLQARWAGGWNNRAAEFIEQLAARIHFEARHFDY